MTSDRIVAAAMAIVVLAAWLVQPASAEAHEVVCPRSPVTVADLVALQADRGPLDRFRMAVVPMNERALACFGGVEIRFVAFVNRPGGLGGTQAYRITPLWITNPTLTLFGSTREVAPGFGDGPFFFISTRPGSGDLQAQFARRWVTVSGHFRDSAAGSCRATGVAGQTPNREQAVAICRTMFVLSSLTEADPPDTATVGQATRIVASDGSTRDASGTSALPVLAGVVWLVALLFAAFKRWSFRRRRVGAAE
jgi:hypothetical protein